MLSLIVGAALAGTTPHPYCNVKMDTGVIPPLAQGTATSLVQVQVLIRHGSRTSSHATPGCWAGDSTAEYDCTDATLLEAPDANLPDGNTYYRKIYSRGRNRLRGSCALGQLVAEGLEMCRASGRHLREAYGSFLPPRVAGHESDFYLRSDDSPRTIASGQALFAALYSHSGPSETLLVPWHTMDEDGDAETMMPSAKVCPPLAKAAARAEAAMRSSPHYANVSVPLAAELSTALNRTIKPSKIGALLDCLMSVQCPTVPSTGGLPPDAFTPALQRRAIAEAADALYAVLNDTDVARLGAGPLLGEILVAIEAAVVSPSKHASPKFALWSGHDTGPMAPVLAALRVGGAEFPRFNDLLAIEVHRLESSSDTMTSGSASSPEGDGDGADEQPEAASTFAVRLVHNGVVVTHHVPGCPPATELCPYEAFHATAAALVPTTDECERADEPSWWPKPERKY